MRAWIIPTVALLVIGLAGFGLGWAVNELQDDGGDEESAAIVGAAGEVEKSFSMTLETDEDFKEAAQRIEALMPDFECMGSWAVSSGHLGCEAGLAGFECTFSIFPELSQPKFVSCRGGTLLPEDFPTCTVESVVRCTGPATNAICEIILTGAPDFSFSVTCQRP